MKEYIKQIPVEAFDQVFYCIIDLARKNSMEYKLSNIPESVLFKIIPNSIDYKYIKLLDVQEICLDEVICHLNFIKVLCKKCPSIISLSLHHSPIQRETIDHLLVYFKNLQKIDLSCSSISMNGLQTLKTFTCKKLKWLDISECEYLNGNSIMFVCLFFTKLEYLNVSYIEDVEGYHLDDLSVLIIIIIYLIKIEFKEINFITFKRFIIYRRIGC